MMTARDAERPPPMPVIVGVPRSGTTLLRLMLDAHPALSIPPETWFLREVAQLRRTDPQACERFLELVTGSDHWVDMGLSPDALRAGVEALGPFDPSEAVRCFYRLYAGRHGKPRFGDKTPGYGAHMPAIARLLPEARFIHLIRDGRDVAASLRGMWFAPNGKFRQLAREWRRQIREIRSSGHGRADYLELRYEALVANPAPELRRICEFIELPYDAAMESYYKSAGLRLGEYQPRFHPDGSLRVSKERRLQSVALARQPPLRSQIGVYRGRMTPGERRVFEEEAADALLELGYATEFRSRPRRDLLVRAQLRRVPRAPGKILREVARLGRRSKQQQQLAD